MIIKTNDKAFTLIELIVWITIILILAFAISNIDFNRLSNSQKLDISAWKIKSTYENIRNNALAWKAIWTNLEIPKYWKMNISKNNNWTITTEAYDDSNNIIYTWSVFIPKDYEISSIKCWEYKQDKSLYDEMTNTWTIKFSGINLKLDINSDWNCDENKDKVLEITIKNKVEKKVITINTLNWLVEITK